MGGDGIATIALFCYNNMLRIETVIIQLWIGKRCVSMIGAVHIACLFEWHAMVSTDDKDGVGDG